MPKGDRRPTPLFDIETARRVGVAPVRDKRTGKVIKRGGSRDPKTGKILKAPRHETFDKTVKSEKRLGFKFFRNKETRAIHTFKKNPDPDKFVPIDIDKLPKSRRASVLEK